MLFYGNLFPLEDAVYMTKKEKFNAVVEAVKEAHAKQQPVLVGTITIETSELLSKMLRREGIPHNVLNAKFHELEAEIVAQAGQAGALILFSGQVPILKQFLIYLMMI